VKDRLLTLVLAIGAFAAFYAVMAPKPEPPQQRATRPLSIETGPNGYLALTRWLEAEQVPVLSLRERYGKLSATPGLDSATGNLLLSTTPQLYPLRDSEVWPLQEWIMDGNTLLVVAGLSDTPDWSMGEGLDSDFMGHMQSMTELRFTQVPDEKVTTPVEPAPTEIKPAQEAPDDVPDSADAQRLSEPRRFEMKSTGPHPLLDGVTTVGALSEFPSSKWRAWVGEAGGVVVELAHDPVSGAPVLWLLPSGDGQVIVSAYGSIFTNKMLGSDDNARLLANIVRWSLHGRGKVIIDDAHQGLVSFYDPVAFFKDSRLHLTLWWLFVLWLVFVIGSQRLRPTVSNWHPVDITGFVRATGGFMARVLQPATVGQQLLTNFFNDVRKLGGMPLDGAPVWDWLHARGGVSAQDVQQLQAMHAKVEQGRRVDLSQLHNLLVRVRAALK